MATFCRECCLHSQVSCVCACECVSVCVWGRVSAGAFPHFPFLFGLDTRSGFFVFNCLLSALVCALIVCSSLGRYGRKIENGRVEGLGKHLSGQTMCDGKWNAFAPGL